MRIIVSASEYRAEYIILPDIPDRLRGWLFQGDGTLFRLEGKFPFFNTTILTCIAKRTCEKVINDR